jgi:effector-binding domain-containing protein
MSVACQLITRPTQPTLAIRTRTAVQDIPSVLGQTFGAIGAYLGKLGEPPACAPFVAYYNMDMQDLDIEIGFPVARSLPGEGNIEASEMPAGDYGACTHVGPFDKMEPTYKALTEFIAQQGRQPTGVAYEVYLSDPSIVPMEELQTQILFPLK